MGKNLVSGEGIFEQKLRKISFPFLKYLNENCFNPHQNIDFFIIFNNKTDQESFLKEFLINSVQNMENHEKSVPIIKFKETVCRVFYEFSIIPAILIQTPVSLLHDFEEDLRISKIDGNFNVYLSIDSIKLMIKLDSISNSLLKTTGNDVTLALFDSGIDFNNNLIPNSHIIKSLDLAGEDNVDYSGHGTMMAGILIGSGAITNNIPYTGIAPNLKIINLKITDKNGLGKISDILMGMELIKDEKIDIVLFGLCSVIPSDGTDILSMMCELFEKKGIILIAPAGNFGPDPQSIGSPGCSKSVFCVGSIDELEKITFFSSRGPTLDGRIKPDLVLPGVKVKTILKNDEKQVANEKLNRGVVSISGTSVSATVFAGIVAHLKEIKPDLDSITLKKIIQKGSVNLYYSRFSQGQGFPNLKQLFEILNVYLPKPINYRLLLRNSSIISIIIIIFLLFLVFIFKLI